MMVAPTLLSDIGAADVAEQKHALIAQDQDLDFTYTEVSGSDVVRRSWCQLLVGLAVLATTVGTVLLEGVATDIPAWLAFGYVYGVFVFQNKFLEWPAIPPHVALLLAGSLGAAWAPTVLQMSGAWKEPAVKLAAWAVDVAVLVCGYRWMVRGPCYEPLEDLTGKTFVITGCNTGIGYETANALAQAGATIVFACRSEEKARAAMEKLVEDADGDIDEEQLVFVPLDVSSMASVRRFVKLLEQTGLAVDTLILNAGVMLSSRNVSVDGLEMTLASNHFGHFLLAHLLLPQMLHEEAKGGKPRIVVVGSNMSYLHDGFDFSEAQPVESESQKVAFMQKPYALFRAYGQSKLANLHFVTELARRLEQRGSRIPVNQIHPGEVLTEVMRDMHPVIVKLQAIFRPVALGFMKSPVQGSFCTVHLATAPELAGASDASGRHFIRLSPAPLSCAGRDMRAAAKLWAISEKVTQLRPEERI